MNHVEDQDQPTPEQPEQEKPATGKGSGRRGGFRWHLPPDQASRMGKKGGKTTRERYGLEHLSDLGEKGGEATKRKMEEEDPDFYSRIGKKGGKTRGPSKRRRGPKPPQQ